MLHRRFAVIKLWPELKTAEDECIARLKTAARELGVECVEVDSFARTTAAPHRQLTSRDVDFVLSLHFETPKCYDIFSFVALWNPLQFYHEWGYRRFTSHLLTHDDFLSCSSPWADDHVVRCTAKDPTRDQPLFRLYHSLAKPLFPPSIGEGRAAYAGINWERVSGRRGRHDELLRLLDRHDYIRIFGPEKFQKVEVWAGYKNYAGSLPFDGVSLLREINRAGIGLALSSEAHIQSELMSNRLFECVAAGVPTICDENPFARRFFGDSLLYIDCSLPPKKTFEQAAGRIEWIRKNPDAAMRMVGEAQEIFRRQFSLCQCLEEIYAGLPQRKESLAALRKPNAAVPIDVLMMMPEFDPAVVERHIASCRAQQDVALRPILLMNGPDAAEHGDSVRTRFEETGLPCRVEAAAFFDFYPDGSVRSRRRTGRVLSECIEGLVESELFAFVAPNERLFSGHFALLLKALEQDEDAGVAASSLLYCHNTDNHDHAVLADDVVLQESAPSMPLGFGRFLIRRSAVEKSAHAALRYLDALALHLIVGSNRIARSRRATVTHDLQSAFNLGFCSAKPGEERQIVLDYAPEFGATAAYTDPMTAFERLDASAKTKIAVELAHSVPLPKWLMNIGFGVYRWWLRRRG